MADGPGGKSVGRVSARVVPDTSRFSRELRTQLEKIEQRVKATIGVELDDKGFQKKVKAVVKKASSETVKLKTRLDSAGLTRETRRAKQAAQKATGKVQLTAGLNLKASLARIRVDLKVLNTLVKGYRISIPVELFGMAKWLGILGAVSGALLAIPHLIGAIGGAAVVAGGLFALLPGIVAGALASIATLVVGTQGFFDALSNAGDAAKFEEALKKLTPSAQAAARALAEFREPLSDIRKSVQESLFQGMADPLRSLKALLPPIKAGLTGIAGGIRNMAKDWIAMATSQKAIQDTGLIMGNIKSGFDTARPSVASFGQALKDITVVATSFLPALGEAVTRASGKFAKWAEEARSSGRLEQSIQNALDKTKQFGRVIADVTVGLRNIFVGLGNGQDFLDMIERVTQSFREWSASKDTQATLGRLGNVLREVADVATDVFGEAFKSLGQILKELEPFLLTFARGLGAVLIGAIQAITPVLRGLARWFSENRAVLVPLVITILSMVTAFKLAATAANAILGIKKSIDAIKAAGSILGNVGAALGRIGAAAWRAAGRAVASVGRFLFAWGTIAASAVKQAAVTSAAWISSAAKSAAFTARYYAIMVAQAIAQWVKMAAAAVLNAAKIVATWLTGLARMAAATLLRTGMMAAAWLANLTLMVTTTISRMATMVGIWIVNWVRMAAVALANAARMAAAWLIAMGPIGLIIAAIIALVVLIIANWDKIVEVTKTVFQAVWDFIVSIFNTVRDAILTAWNAVLDFFRNIPGWIGDALSTVGEVLSWPFRQAWDWVVEQWNKVSGFFDGIVDAIDSAVSGVWEVLTWPFRKAWDIIKGIWEDIQDIISGIGDAVGDAMSFLGFSDEMKLSVPGVTVPVAFADASVPSLGFEPYAGEDLTPDTRGLDGLLSSVDRSTSDLSRSLGASPGGSDNDSLADRVEEALRGWSIVLDPRGVARLARKGQTLNDRRG